MTGSTSNVAARLKRVLCPRVYRWLRAAGRAADAEGLRVYTAGGLVRDVLLGRPTVDLDLVLVGDGARFARRLAARRGLPVFVHPRFGTASIIFPDHWKIDIVTARKERYAEPVALPTVAPGSIVEDLYRRDFTINAMAVAINREQFGDMLDPFGGLRDLRRKVVRVLHEQSLEDDPTRMYRAVRFAARYGFRIDAGTRILIRRTIRKRLVQQLSNARLRQEMQLILSEREPWKPVSFLAQLGLLRAIDPGFVPPPPYPLPRRGDGDLSTQWIARLYTALNRSSDATARRVLVRLGFGERAVRDLGAARRARRSIDQWRYRKPEPSTIVGVLEGLSEEALSYLAARSAAVARRHIAAYRTRYRDVKPALTGSDLQSLGIPPGPIYRRLLERLRDARLNGGAKTKREELALIRRWARSRPR